MVLDPFTSLSLATSIVQFVDFGSKIFAESVRIQRSASGTAPDIVDLQAATDQLKDISRQLERKTNVSSDSDKAISTLAHLCQSEADKLRAILEKLVGRLGAGKWRCLLHALETEMRRDKIAQLQKNLGRIQTQLMFHLLILTRYPLSSPSLREAH